MKAREYTQIEPLHEMPTGPYVDYGNREEALSDALRGVEMGAYDELIIGWLLRHLDNPTMRTLISLIERVRGAGMLSVVELAERLEHRRPAGTGSESGVCRGRR